VGPRGVPPTGRLVLGASGLTTLGALPPFLLGAQAILIMEDLRFGPGGLGLAVGVFFAAAAVATLGGAPWFERWDGRTGRLVAGGLVGTGGLATAFLVHTWVGLLAAMTILGLANAACQGSANKTVAAVVPMHRRGLGFGVKQSAVPLAVMLGGLAVPTMTALLGWRSTFLVTAVVGLLVLTLALGSPARQPVGRSARAAGARARAFSADVSAARALQRAPRGPLLLCGAGIAFANMAGNFLGAYLASWAHGVGLTLNQAGLLLAAGSGLCVLVRIGSGHGADRRHGGNLPVVAMMLCGGAVSVALLGAVAEPWAVVVFGLLAFGLGWSWPGLMLYAVARVGRDAPTQASSFVQAGGFLGGAVGPALMGWVVTSVGFREAWWCAAGALLVAGGLVLAARAGFHRDLRRRPPQQPFGFGGGRHHPRYVVGPE
jgi:MFS family permease